MLQMCQLSLPAPEVASMSHGCDMHMSTMRDALWNHLVSFFLGGTTHDFCDISVLVRKSEE